MKTVRRLSKTLAGLLAAGALALVPFSLRAQDDGPGYIHVVFADVKPSANAEFEAVIKEIVAAQQAAGHPFMHVYQRIRGDSGYTIFGLDSDMNDLPQLDLNPQLGSRVTGALNGIRRVTLAMSPEISIASDSMEPSGQHMRVVTRTVSPGSAQDFFELQRDEFVPALREGGMTDRRGGRVMAGGNPNTFVAFTYADEFNGGGVNLPEVMGQRQFDSAVDRANSMVVNVEDYRYLFRPDLSFTAAQ